MTASALLPDRATLSAFIGAMFRHADEDTFISLRAFEDGKREQPPLFVDGVKVGRPELIDWTFNRAKQAARHEKTANFCPPVATFDDQRKAEERNIANGLGLSVECDEAPTQARGTLAAILGEPTVTCASGGVWTNPETGECEDKLHLHWRLTEPTRDPADHARLKRARKLACKLVGADATGVPVNHPFRWPGSVHRKGEPRLARIVAETENEIELGDALDKLEAARPDAEPDRPRASGDFADQDAKRGDLVDIASALAVIPNADEKWVHWNHIGMATWKASDGRAFAAFDAWSQKSSKYDAAAAVERWNHYSTSPPTEVGAGSLYRLARKVMPTWRRPTLIAKDAKRAADEAERMHERFHDERWNEYDNGPGAEQPKPKPPDLVWYGDKLPEPPAMLVRGLIPQAQVGIIAGVFSAGKTFVAGDLTVCLMLSVPFAGREVLRPGAVLWLAAEGANEIDARIKAAALARAVDGEPTKLPFARQAFDVPKLTAPDAEAQILALVDGFKAGLSERFPGVELVMIVIDTVGSAAGFTDASGPNEPQAVFDMLRRVNMKTNALVLVVDHFGKVTETGVMGSSVKAQTAEVVLAILAEKKLEGEITNRRMAVHKLRSGAGGDVIPFKLRQVPLSGFDGTTCVIDWAEAAEVKADKPKVEKQDWSGNARIFKSAMERAMIDFGKMLKPYLNGPERKVVQAEKVRAEFYATYTAESQEAKKKAFRRFLENAQGKQLIAAREIGGVDHLWFATDDDFAELADRGDTQGDRDNAL